MSNFFAGIGRVFEGAGKAFNDNVVRAVTKAVEDTAEAITETVVKPVNKAAQAINENVVKPVSNAVEETVVKPVARGLFGAAGDEARKVDKTLDDAGKMVGDKHLNKALNEAVGKPLTKALDKAAGTAVVEPASKTPERVVKG